MIICVKRSWLRLAGADALVVWANFLDRSCESMGEIRSLLYHELHTCGEGLPAPTRGGRASATAQRCRRQGCMLQRRLPRSGRCRKAGGRAGTAPPAAGTARVLTRCTMHKRIINRTQLVARTQLRKQTRSFYVPEKEKQGQHRGAGGRRRLGDGGRNQPRGPTRAVPGNASQGHIPERTVHVLLQQSCFSRAASAELLQRNCFSEAASAGGACFFRRFENFSPPKEKKNSATKTKVQHA